VPVTIRDVAKVSGVSVKTVSRVLNDEPWVHGDTRARVEKAIGDLNFYPNPLARGLSASRMRALGLIVPDIANPFFAQVIDGCATISEQHGYNLFLSSGGDAPGRVAAHLQALLSHRVSGLILWVSDLTDVALHDTMQRMKYSCPAVFIDQPFDPESLIRMGYAATGVAQQDVGALATEHLLAEGRRRIAHIGLFGVGAGQWVGDQRLEGYRRVLGAHHEPVDDRRIHRVTHATIREGAHAMRALLAQHPQPDGLFAFNDLIAVGALLACRQAHLRVPEDIAIVGVDDTDIAAVTEPPLTTIRLYQRQTGERAAEMLFGLMQTDAGSSSPVAVADSAPPAPELVVRRSSTLRSVPSTSLDDFLGEES